MSNARRVMVALVAAFMSVFLFAQSASAQPMTPLRNKGVIDMTIRACGSSAGWQANAARNGLTAANNYTVYLNRTYDIQCTSGGGSGAPASNSSGWTRPAVMSCFPNYGGRVFGAPRGGGTRSHKGIDLGPISGVYRGENVYAIAAGTIISRTSGGGAGNTLSIRHADGSVSKYFHLSGWNRTTGTVKFDEIIGWVGDTGNAAVSRGGGGPHLHFETWLHGVAQNPVSFMNARGVRLAC